MTSQEVRRWYDLQYNADTKTARRPFDAYLPILNYLDCKPPATFLDIACGRGNLLRAAHEKGLETFGIDISPEAVKTAKAIAPQSDIRIGNAEALDFSDGLFDFVTCLGALEHFLDIPKGLSEMRRVAKDTARFCVMVPNADFVFWKLTGKHGTEQHELQEVVLSLREWRGIFEGNGFEILAVHADTWFLKFFPHTFLGKCKRLIAFVVWFLIPLRYNYQFAFILRKENRE